MWLRWEMKAQAQCRAHPTDHPPTCSLPRPPARSAIRELLAALRDPYSRFVPPSDFAAMLKYDVSGVGLNLGTAEEFANKTVGGSGMGTRAARGWQGGCGGFGEGRRG
jgi:hypothetical protein